MILRRYVWFGKHIAWIALSVQFLSEHRLKDSKDIYMFSWFTARNHRRRNAHNFYGSIVALSRAPDLYLKFGVPDTVEGRFEILVLHMFAALERLSHENSAQRKLNQDLVNLFFTDMDTSERELGVGDLKVPKKMRTLAAVFEERIEAYKTAFDDAEMHALSDEFEQNIYNGMATSQKSAKKLSGYTHTLRTKMADTPINEFMDENFDLWAERRSQ